MKDVFSYDNNIKTEGQVASADFARVSVKQGGGRNALVQSVDVNYQQQIEEVTQVGSTQIYWLPGRPQGKIGIQSVVGSDGFFGDWKAPCGKIDTASISVEGGKCGFQGTGSLFFKGAVVESLNSQLNTGRQTIAQGASIRVANMRAS
tara:strand:- start:902 stop:1345 length:444 start_codon:yes stop_codon:yes gene_type:complete